jgi:hypothetical protein
VHALSDRHGLRAGDLSQPDQPRDVDLQRRRHVHSDREDRLHAVAVLERRVQYELRGQQRLCAELQVQHLERRQRLRQVISNFDEDLPTNP